MFLTVLVAVLAGVGVLLGLGAYLRARFRCLPLGARRTGVRRAVVLTALAGVAMLVPDAVAGDLVNGVGVAVYRVVALSWLVVVAAVMALTSARVVDPIAARARRVVPARLSGRRRAPAGFPTTWDALIEHDRAMSARLLAYDHDLELAVNHPVMHDYADPRTAAAVRAMLHCDTVRTPAPPAGARVVHETAYGRAVLDFENALTAAEENATRLARSTFTDDERRALEEAAATLAFVREHATTPAERDVAYLQVRDLLERHPRTRTHDPRAVREHPFLTVPERAAS